MVERVNRKSTIRGGNARARPAVSVVIPCYNYGRFVGEAIASVLAQDCRDFEVLVVDDGSTDDSAAVIDRYTAADTRVRCIRQTNAGLPAARNTGIRAATADYVAFLDADDLYPTDFLSHGLAAFRRLGGEWALVACNTRHVNEKGEGLYHFRDRHERPAGEITLKDLIKQSWFSPSSVMVRRAALLAAGEFDTALRATEDRDMWIRIACVGRVYRDTQPRILARRHGTNMSTEPERMLISGRAVLHKCLAGNYVPRSQVTFWLQARALLHYNVAWTFVIAGHRRAGIGLTLRSILLWPFFLRPTRLRQPPLFRLRALRRFLFPARAAAGGNS